MGPTAGKPAVEACLCHFNVIVKGTGQVFPGGPPVVKAALGYDISKEELGGWRVATSSGMVDNVAENESEAFAIVRRFLSYLPSNVWEMPPRIEPRDDPNRRDEELLSVVPRDRKKPYDPYEILDHVLDHDSLFEIAPFYGTAYVTALARVNGYPVGVIINNPMSSSGGAMDVAAGDKVLRFLQLCDTFHMPLACFIDEPGFMAGREAQERGIVRTASRVVQAIHQTKMPWISFVVRQVYGFGTSLAFRASGMCERYAWPSALVGSMRIKAGALPTHHMAGAFGIHDIVDPRDTRPLLRDFVEAAQGVLRTHFGPGDGPSYRL
jgi:acetyl-CoA carboxylase carboxyltransferase component